MKNYTWFEKFLMTSFVVVVLIAIALSTCSCRTKRVETSYKEKTETNINQTTTTQHQSKTESNINHFFDITKILSDNSVENWIFYDTEKPIDSLTGKPPIKAELKRQKNITAGETSTSETNFKTNAENLTNTVSNLNFEQKTDITDNSDTKTVSMAWLKWLLLGIFVSGLVFSFGK